MGKAYHRKQILVLGRGPKPRGTGIRYIETVRPVVRELTPEDIAAQEGERQKQVALEQQRRQRDLDINTVMRVVGKMLTEWKVTRDRDDRRLQEFSGWAADSVCSKFPPDDREVAEEYAEAVEHATWDAPLTLHELDIAVSWKVRGKRRTPTAQVIERAGEAVRAVAEKCCDGYGFDFPRFVQLLKHRSRKVAHDNTIVDRALDYVIEQFVKKQAEEDHSNAVASSPFAQPIRAHGGI